jgi:pimeloyl-ACP methyl ester carboxylesterase
LLIGGSFSDMNAWEPSTLRNLSSNHTVIVFDQRGIRNTTTGSKPYSIQQLANDTSGLLDALKIQKANVLGYSLGSFVAQQLAVTHPEKVNRLILAAASCGGKEAIPQSHLLLQFLSQIANKSMNNIPVAPEEVKRALSYSFGSGWMKSHPNYLEINPIPKAKDLFGSSPPNTIKQQFKIPQNWFATNWSGICDELTKISVSTLAITGTDDNNVPPANSLIIIEKNPWILACTDKGCWTCIISAIS